MVNKEIKLTIEEYLKNNQSFVTIFFIFLLINCLILWGFYGLYQGSGDSARYFFSTLAQSQAAIVAIVITLTLVAVQLSSQTYTPRVMELFSKSKMFWALLSFYGISIIYDVAVLAVIPPIQSDRPLSEPILIFGIEVTFNTFILVGLILTICTFSLLFPFIINVIKQLKPEMIVEGIVKATNVNEIITAAENPSVDDPLLPMKEIGKKALSSGDDLTALRVITELSQVAEEVIRDRDFVKRKTRKETLNDLSFSSEMKDEEELQEGDFEERYNRYLEKKQKREIEERQKDDSDNNVISYFTSYLSDLTERSFQCKSIVILNNIALCLNTIGLSLSKKKATVVINILGELKEMEKLVLEKGLEKDTWAPIGYFKIISVEAANNWEWGAVEYSIGVLGLFVSKYAKHEIQYYDEDKIYGVIGVIQRPYLIVESINEIGKAIVKAIPNIDNRHRIEINEDCFEGLIEINYSVKHLNEMAEIAIEREWWGWDRTMTGVVGAITGICGSLIHKGGENLHHPINPTTLMAKSLEKIATSSTNSEVYYETKSIITILETYANYLANKSSRNVSCVIDSLIAIYKFVYLNHCKGVPCDMMLDAPDSLGEIGRLTMAKDNKWLTDAELKKLKDDGFADPESSRPPTQKIVDAIEEIGINSSKNSWREIAEFSARNIIFFGTAYSKCGNKEICQKLAVKLKKLNNAYKNKFGSLVTEILKENEIGKTFGLYENSTNDIGVIELHERKMDGDDFKAFLLFKEQYEKR